MYEVKEYFDGTKLFYGVYIKTMRNSYDQPPSDEDNIVVLCFSKEIANKIKNLLEDDNLLEEHSVDF